MTDSIEGESRSTNGVIERPVSPEEIAEEAELAGRIADQAGLIYLHEAGVIRHEETTEKSEIDAIWNSLQDQYPRFADRIAQFSRMTDDAYLARYHWDLLVELGSFQGVRNPISRRMLTDLLLTNILDGTSSYRSRDVVTLPLAKLEEARIAAAFPSGVRDAGPSQIARMYLRGEIPLGRPAPTVH